MLMDMVLTSSAGLPELNLIRRWSASLNHGSPLFLKGNMNKKAKILVCKAKKKTPIEGLSEEMNVIASQNMDFASARRRVRSAFMDVQQQLDHCLFKMAPTGIRMEEWYERNSKGLEIFCKSWLPEKGVQMKGALYFCHGYGDTCTFFFEGRPEVRGLPHFLLGQSMGGAVALKVHLKEPQNWDGVILVAPMCKIAEDVKPPPAVLKVLTLLANLMPEAKLFPTKDLAELAFRDLKKRKLADYNVISYSDQTRLKTAVELLKATSDIESQVEKVSSPLLILHGAADKVTDPLVSRFLYEKAASKDKTLKLYEEAYHCILEGEPDHTIFSVLNDIIEWMDSHCSIKL